MNRTLVLGVALSLSACSVVDIDEDGFVAPEDCDDLDPDHNPDTPEVCDGVDNNCNGIIDEGVTITVFTDADGDGFGDPASQAQVCVAEAGQVADRNDCDDTRALVYPRAPERCNGIDDDCIPETEDLRGAYFEGSEGTQLLIKRSDNPSAHHDLLIEEDGTLLFCKGSYNASVLIDGAQVTIKSDQETGTTLRGELGDGPVLHVRDSQVTVQGLYLYGGTPVRRADGQTYGAIAYCEGDTASLTVNNGLLSEGHADRGGAMAAVDGCDLVVRDSVIAQNTATALGAGLYADGGVHRIQDTTIAANRSGAAGGGVHVSGGATAVLSDVSISQNTSADRGAGLHIIDSDVQWESPKSESINNGNQGEPGAGVYLDGSTFSSNNVDFGKNSGGTDQREIFVVGAPGAYNAYGPSTFTCDPDGCGVSTPVFVTEPAGPEETIPIGDALSAANVFVVGRDATLNSVELFIGATGTCDAVLYVLESRQPVGRGASWTALRTRPFDLAGPAGWRASPPLGVPFKPNWAYAVGIQATCTGGSVDWGRGELSGDAPPFGETDAWTLGPADPMGGFTTYAADGEAWLMRLDITAL